MEQEKTNSSMTAQRLSRIAAGVIGTVFLGALGSGLWDAIFRPGIGSIARYFTRLSSTLDNQIFTSAALNPEPVTPLLLLMTLLIAPTAIGSWFFFKGFINLPLSRLLDKRINTTLSIAATRDKQERYLINMLRTTGLLGTLLSIAILFTLWLGISVQNESVLVWRKFNQNLDICAPYMDTEQKTLLRSAFRQIKSRNDFVQIQHTLDNISSQHDIKLNWNENS